MSTLGREEIIRAGKPCIESIEVPEWSGQVYLRTMTGNERDRWESEILSRRGESNNGHSQTSVNLVGARALLASMTLCDVDGVRLFGDSPEELAVVGGLSASGLDRIWSSALRINALRDQDIEKLEGN